MTLAAMQPWTRIVILLSTVTVVFCQDYYQNDYQASYMGKMGKSLGKMGKSLGQGFRSGAKRMGEIANTGYLKAKQWGSAIHGGMQNAAKAGGKMLQTGMNKARQMGSGLAARAGKWGQSLGKRFG